MRRSILHLPAILGVLLWFIGCRDHRPQAVRLEERTVRPPVSVVIFFVDGLNHDRFEELIATGRLPHIKARFVDGGVGVEHAVVSLPAVTYANAVSLITGRHPGHHGVLGNQWFDRDRWLLRDYGFASTYQQVNEDFSCPTVYEVLEDRFTVNVQGHTRRGASWVIDNKLSSGLAWSLGDYTSVDERVGACLGEVAAAADRAGRWPGVYFNYFPGVDEVGHRFGVSSTRYEQALIAVDKAVGRIVNWMEEMKPARERYYVLVTDHGHVPLSGDKVLDLWRWLRRQHGLRVHQGACQGGWLSWRRARLREAEVILICDGSRRASLHLREGDDWRRPASPERIREVVGAPEGAGISGGLRDLAGVGLVCFREDADTVRVCAGAKAILIERRHRGPVKEYRVRGAGQGPQRDGEKRTSDPLGYRRVPELRAFLDAGWHTSRAWLAATAHTRYPDFVPQIVEMFDAPRAGDVVAFAADGWSFEAGPCGGHGSCLASDMRVPLFFAGTGLPGGARIPCARLVDVMPTVLDLLGRNLLPEGAEPLDGVSLLPMLKSAGHAGNGFFLAPQCSNAASRSEPRAQARGPQCASREPPPRWSPGSRPVLGLASRGCQKSPAPGRTKP